MSESPPNLTVDQVYNGWTSDPDSIHPSYRNKAFRKRTVAACGGDAKVAANPLRLWTPLVATRMIPEHCFESVYEWLETLPDTVWDELLQYVERGAACTLIVFGGRYLTLSLVGSVFDVETCGLSHSLPTDWWEAKMINLTTLYHASKDRAGKWTQPPDQSGPTPTPRPRA